MNREGVAAGTSQKTCLASPEGESSFERLLRRTVRRTSALRGVGAIVCRFVGRMCEAGFGSGKGDRIYFFYVLILIIDPKDEKIIAFRTRRDGFRGLLRRQRLDDTAPPRRFRKI